MCLIDFSYVIVVCCQNGYTALMMAHRDDHEVIVSMLLNAGATVNDKSVDVTEFDQSLIVT